MWLGSGTMELSYSIMEPKIFDIFRFKMLGSIYICDCLPVTMLCCNFLQYYAEINFRIRLR